MRCNPRNHVADLLDPRLEQLRAWRDAPFAEGRAGSTIRRQALAAIAARAQREEARRQLGRSLARPGSRPATGSTAPQTSWRVLDSRRHRPSRPSSVPRDCWPGPRARARSSDTARTTPPKNQPPRARTQSSRPRTCRLSASTTQGRLDLHRGHRGTPWTIGATRFRALQVGQLMIAMTTRSEPAGPSVAWLLPHPAERASGPIRSATRRTCVNRSIETTSTSCSTRSTPRTRTRHMTASAPFRAHLRRRRDSHAACSRTRAR